MIVKMNSSECRGKLTTKKKVQTIVVVNSFEELSTNFSNLKYADVLIYTGDINELISSFTPDSVSAFPFKLYIQYTVKNPDLINMSLLDELNGYNILCRVPDDYCNMEQLFNINSMYPDVYFCGGHLLKLDGVNIGLFDSERLKRYVFKDEYSCQEDVVSLADIGDYSFSIPKEKGVSLPKPKKVKEKVAKLPKVSKPKKSVKQSKFSKGGLTAF